MYLNTYDKYLSNETNFTLISNITDKKKFQQLFNITHNLLTARTRFISTRYLIYYLRTHMTYPF